MNVDGQLNAIVDAILRFEARLATFAQPLARMLETPPSTIRRRRGSGQPATRPTTQRTVPTIPGAAPSRAAA